MKRTSAPLAAMLLAQLSALHAADAIPVQPPSNDHKAPVSPDAGKDSKAVPLERMRQVYDEVKTPFKYGVVIRGEANQKVDSPSVFRKDGQWYMVYVTITGSVGYETCLARSADLLKWEKLGEILSFRPDGWDSLAAGRLPRAERYDLGREQ